MTPYDIFHFEFLSEPIRLFLIKWAFFTLGAFLLGSWKKEWLTKKWEAGDRWLNAHRKYFWAFLGLLAFFAAAYYGLARYLLYRGYFVNLWDLGGFDNLVWRLAHFQGQSTHYFRANNFLGDHFQPILYLLAPFYWILPAPHALLIAELLAILAGLIPLTLLTLKKLNSPLTALALAILYLFSTGIYAALLYPSHPSTFIPLFFLMVFYFYETQNWKWFWVSTLLLLSTKENAAIYLAFFGLWQLLYRPTKKIGAILLGGGLAVAGLLWFVLMPIFRGRAETDTYFIDPLIQQNKDMLADIHQSLLLLVYTATSNFWKWQLVVTTFSGFGFITLDSIGSLILVIPFIAERVLAGQGGIWMPYFHYGAPVVPVLCFSAILLFTYLSKSKGLRHLIPVFLVIALFSQYQTYKVLDFHWFNFRADIAKMKSEPIVTLDKAVALIPRDASVIATNGVATHLTDRRVLNVFDRDKYNGYDVAFFDYATTQWYIRSERQTQKYEYAVAHDPGWEVLFAKGSTRVYAKTDWLKNHPAVSQKAKKIGK